MAGPSRFAVVGSVFASRDFRLFCAGETISLVGDQFYLVALPWLVLQTTGSSLAIGTVTATASAPRALFMLFAGALNDRLSPRALMLWSSAVRMALAALLALLVLSDVAHLRMLYGFALAFGVGDAFYFPARGSLVPRLLPPSSLLMGNAIVEGSNQFAMFAGPILAGMLIAAFDRPVGAASASSLRGLGFAFAVDAATFVFSGLFVWLMRTRGAGSATTLRQVRTSLWRSVVDGLAIAKADPFIRSTFLLVGLGNFLITGPLYVGLPVLAHTRFAGGAGDLGLVLSLFGLGSVTGVVVAAVGARSSVRPPVVALFFCPLTLGVGLTLLGFVHRAGTASPIVAIMGVAQGYLVLQFITFVQTRTAPALLGRVISLLTFLVVGLSPLSSALAGALLGVSVTRLFAGAGAALVGVVVAAFLTPAVRSSFRSTAGPKQTDVTADGL